jgi:very-short-patch-repair endonuclease
MWCWLRNRRFFGYKFRRQYPVCHYVLDFYCPQLKIAIEMDGPQHDTLWLRQYDEERTRKLSERGITVMRIPNEMLIRDPRLVEEWIRAAINVARR